jgi:hypothetical protein
VDNIEEKKININIPFLTLSKAENECWRTKKEDFHPLL